MYEQASKEALKVVGIYYQKLSESLMSVVGIIAFASRTTAVVRLHISCYALAQHVLCACNPAVVQ